MEQWKITNKSVLILPILVLLMMGIVFAPDARAFYYDCEDARGRAVGSVQDDQLGLIARVGVDPVGGEALVYFNPGLLTWIHPATRLFFFLHECAHHQLGHPLDSGLPAEIEQAADCWAFAMLAEKKRVTGEDLNTFQRDLYTFGKDEWERVPGPRRGIEPQICAS